MNPHLHIAFIGGGNMAAALAAGMADRILPAGNIHVVEINTAAHAAWQARGVSVASAPDHMLAQADIWIFAVKPQVMRDVVAACKPWLRDKTLAVSIAAGVRSDTLAEWLGEAGAPWSRLVRCMPNTPALVGAGATGLAALPGVSAADRDQVEAIMGAVGTTVWVDDDAGLDAVTAVSGSGPAYVFLFIEALIAGGVKVGLTAGQARELALATLAGATRLAAESDETPATLRERVTSKGGTTAAALAAFEKADFTGIVATAVAAAAERSRELAAGA
ncbi:pyrroline-5-carboxylate reductase [Schauerella aestuarii]|uniref:pyrroline-5-carboxylate reductase n=1 Tax=Schauerella aestuarii TaxID=2511204 RepID=UPI00136924C7|nr:pyrroline-5-carboxylate reductase [Achromobacter aestuarii]MYZ44518.1 pyrroline-5-carboxylate reductase [Achromobacter aestuarii]